ncbi:MFS transporter [Persicobacter diffluens]|uniref:MFS transporter n=1 Tax=Persicobacter diffluens TaxID=981 RepID=A0AAN4W4S0_9BACT|nr:MFS transporter [Persicobacter diffluens]
MKPNSTSLFRGLFPVLFAFFVTGFVDIVGISVGFVKMDFNLSETEAQLLPSMVFIWFFLLAVPAGMAQFKMGKRRMLQLGMLVTIAGMLVPLLPYSYPVMLITFTLVGLGNTLIQVSTNPLMMQVVSNDKLSSFLSVGQVLKSTASLLGPVLVAFMAAQFGNWRLLFPLYGALALLNGVWLSATPNIIAGEKITFSVGDSLRLLKDKQVFIAFACIFLCVGLDVGMYAKITSFLVDNFQVAKEEAGLTISLYFFSAMFGRMIAGIVLKFVNDRLFLALNLILALSGLVLMMFAPTVLLVQVGIFAFGLGISPIFPIVFSEILKAKPSLSDPISGLMVMGIVGGAIVPPILGVLTDLYGHIVSMSIFAASLLYIIIVNQIALSKNKQVKMEEDLKERELV